MRLGRLRGLFTLLGDGVEHGSRAVERVQLGMAARPFGILEAIPPIAAPVRVVHAAHDTVVALVHTNVRVVNRLVGSLIGAAIGATEAVTTVVEEAQRGRARTAPEQSEP